MQEKDTYTIRNRCKSSILFLTILIMSLPIILCYDFLLVEQSKAKNLLSNTDVNLEKDKKIENSPTNKTVNNSAEKTSSKNSVEKPVEAPNTRKDGREKDNKVHKERPFPSIAAEEVYTFGQKDGQKFSFLTFDDGPNTVITPQVLEILKYYEVKATFFVLGSYVDKNPHILKRIFDEGHAVANHTYSHDYNKIYPNKSVNIDAFQAELEKTKDAIIKIIGYPSSTRVVRFPGGSFESWKNPMKDKLLSQGMYFLDWNAENKDGLKHNVSIEEQLNTLRENINFAESRNENLVVLMHDSATKQSTVDALPAIIELLQSKGYSFALIH
ncbi:MAG TPA: polysaccharide deacetylase [Clostridium sp.]|jgi:peptidoglycan/xylan/chitin deacetylase (PgdA/CDA1 family)|nr:polysaccharide deacetylase [Clostridia bacterium]HCW03970.1 polysaccharide deacetylase [Clostridium sp.]